MILMSDHMLIIKLRLPDKKQRLSKRDGYRLIYMVSQEAEVVTFLDIYPKNGPSQQLDIDDEVIDDLLRQFMKEFDEASLACEDLKSWM